MLYIMTTETRLPENYKLSQASWWNYTKLKEWDNKLRILTSPIIWFEYFTVENKPKRSKKMFESTPDIKDDGKVKVFRAFVVRNYDDKQLQVMEVTQNTIKQQLFEYSRDEDYGDPKTYDIKINRTGKDLETKYQVKPLPPKEFAEKSVIEYAKTIKLEALYDGLDPFAEAKKNDQPF